jgi:hypothetical protein
MKIELNKREIYLIWKSLYAELDHQKFLQGFGNDRKETIEKSLYAILYRFKSSEYSLTGEALVIKE